MRFPVQEWANKLKVIDVWKSGNDTGIVTDRRLYDKGFAGNRAPSVRPYKGFLIHGTASGGNSLSFLAGGSWGSSYACVPYLIPRGTSATLYKLIPDGHRGWSAGDSEWRGVTDETLNSELLPVEIENRQNWSEAIQPTQYIKLALLYAFESAHYQLQDNMVVSHSLIAVPHGRRSDPEAGLFSYGTFWDLVMQIRRAWPTNWPFPVWWGGSQPD